MGASTRSDGYFLGVDGGGTKTAFVLTDREGRELARHEGGSSYHIQIGVESLHTLLHDGVHAVLEPGVLTDLLVAGGSPQDVVEAVRDVVRAAGEPDNHAMVVVDLR